MTTLTSPPPRNTPLFHQPMQIAQPQPQVSGGKADPEPAPVQGALRGPTFSQPWSGWFRNIYNILQGGKTEDVVVGGVTLHFQNGVYKGHS